VEQQLKQARYLTVSLPHPAESGNFLWCMTNKITVLPDSYSEVAFTVIDHSLC